MATFAKQFQMQIIFCETNFSIKRIKLQQAIEVAAGVTQQLLAMQMLGKRENIYLHQACEINYFRITIQTIPIPVTVLGQTLRSIQHKVVGPLQQHI